MTPGASAALAHRLAPDLVAADGSERPITVDQTNVSVVVAERVVVKWLQPPVPEPHPGVELLAHLREVGFDEMPPFVGHHVEAGHVDAIVTGLVPGALDGWDWFVDLMVGVATGTQPAAAVMASARRIGALAARLHVALATPSSVLPQPTATAPVEAEAARCRALLAEAADVALGEAGALVAALAPRIGGAIDELGTIGETAVQRLHGDLHVGQLLLADNRRLYVTDFDGNPLSEPVERRWRRPAAVDLAALVQSVDHSGRIAGRRHPDATELLEPVIADAVAETLAGYRRELHDRGAVHLLDERLLWPLRVAQELHELVYAAHHLPRWTYAPVATLTAMFPD
jgi:maltokinase